VFVSVNSVLIALQAEEGTDWRTLDLVATCRTVPFFRSFLNKYGLSPGLTEFIVVWGVESVVKRKDLYG
jgi:hypothetical protein